MAIAPKKSNGKVQTTAVDNKKLQTFFFPNILNGVGIKAKTKEEAEKKAKQLRDDAGGPQEKSE